MMASAVNVSAGFAVGRKRIAVWDLIQWAFRAECARIETGAGPRTLSGTGYVMAQLEVGRVDGGGHSLPHHDADLVADALAHLPEARGGLRMALWIAELARVGRVPDWMPDARPAVRPAVTHTNQHGIRAGTVDAAQFGVDGWPAQRRRNRKGVIVEDAVTCCPVVIRPAAWEIASARRDYLRWWDALWEVRETFSIYNNLTAHEVTDVMPERAPWEPRREKRC
ncbi:hypothetical protein PVW47_01460 [Marinovum sp. SP66]|uniref:hypothetical protein n=1 Tax=Marinovum TaxID=367771 RepID=UPI00237BE9B4|nr:hypothetical protein [Marinovum sp. SP66]MDD9738440.1 hypothetical protein [Marinovum sp. SP66]